VCAAYHQLLLIVYTTHLAQDRQRERSLDKKRENKEEEEDIKDLSSVRQVWDIGKREHLHDYIILCIWNSIVETLEREGDSRVQVRCREEKEERRRPILTILSYKPLAYRGLCAI
jgi:hypothetical protein